MWWVRLSLLLCLVVFLIEVRLTNAHDAINQRHGHISNRKLPRKLNLDGSLDNHHHRNEVDDTTGHDHKTQKTDDKTGLQFVGPKHLRVKINRHGKKKNRPNGQKGRERKRHNMNHRQGRKGRKGGHKKRHGRKGGHKKRHERKNQTKAPKDNLKDLAINVIEKNKAFTSQIDTKTDE